ncbi:hypothetical protein ER308_01665 [Egibacter rhizosphaerae]|uniref:Alpha/beta hydrolase n=1 Tax=Egibacter rhizosphaerae TaxID=1670831 RepID=A0A411YAY8_9ACTN|nr:hypothetical protein [Egibacter rhizosphaerae]QBI18403.1 hypothetical protein ER308_01665 [Egibacter rhizosphaerae]
MPAVSTRDESLQSAEVKRRPRAAWLLVPALLAATVALLPGLPAWPGVVHLVALPPLDVFADLRALLSWAPSHPWAWFGIAASIAGRTALLAALLPGPWRARLPFAAAFYGTAAPFALLAAQLNFVAHAALYSRLLWAATTLTGLVAVVLAPSPWTGQPTLRRALATSVRGGLRLGPLAVYALALVTIGTLADRSSPSGVAMLVLASALLTAATATWLSRPPEPRAIPALVLAAGALALLLVVVSRGEDAVEADARPGSLLMMSGINSASGDGAAFETDPRALGFTCEQTYYYSYAGTGEGQPRGDAVCPIRTGAPYEQGHTQRAFNEQVQLLAAQAADLDEPLTIAAHSQAAWVAWAAAAEGALPRDSRLLLVGPFPDNPVGWPQPSADGSGRVGGDGFRMLAPLAEAVDFHFDVDAPLSRELLGRPRSAAGILADPLPEGTRALSLTATSDLGLMPQGWRIEGAEDACPLREAHPYLPLTPGLHRAANAFLDGRSQPPCPSWRRQLVHLSRPWGVPPHDSATTSAPPLARIPREEFSSRL